MTKQTKPKKEPAADWFDRLWSQKSILKQIYFIRKMVFIYLGVTGLFSKFINKYLEKDKQYSFIELGCGGSSYLPYLAKKYSNLQLFGIDKSLIGCKLVALGEDGKLSSANIVCGDVLQCPLKPEKFDIVFSFGLIEHFDHTEKMIEKHVDILKPGGLLICVIPNVIGIQGKIYGLKLWIPEGFPPKYLKGWIWGMKVITMRDLETWYAKNGLKDIKVQPIGGINPFLIMESYHSESHPLSGKLFRFVYRYLLFLPSMAINVPFLFRLNSQNFSPFFIAVGVKNKKK